MTDRGSVRSISKLLGNYPEPNPRRPVRYGPCCKSCRILVSGSELPARRMPQCHRPGIVSPSPTPTHRTPPESLPFAWLDGARPYFIQRRKLSGPKRRRHSARYSPIKLTMPSRTSKSRCCKTTYSDPVISPPAFLRNCTAAFIEV